MPIDIQLFRAEGNPDAIRKSQLARNASVELVDDIIAKDDRWRYLTGSIDDLRAKKNKIQKEIAPKMKSKEPCGDLVAEMKAIGETIVAEENEQKDLKLVIDKLVTTVGNIVDESVPIGVDEDECNVVLRKWGTPRDPKVETGLLNHHDLLWRIGGYEPDRGSTVAGHRGYFLKDVGVMLNQAFINYGIAFMRKRDYTLLQPPYMMKKDIMAGVAQLEQFDEELYKVGGEESDKYLIATSEQPICAYHKDEWMDEKALPIKYSGISTCFRKEAGSAGKDNWGIFRVHQFEKVEQFVITDGDLAVSKLMQEEMIKQSEEFYQSLGFPYHVIAICSGALNNAAIKKLDLECWFPGYDAYRELVSCSNCTDYQSRAMEIRCGQKKLGDREKKYVHMLNSTLCATGRAICCLLETYQEADGVRIPEVLVPFMGGITFMPFVRESKPVDPAVKKALEKAAKAPPKPEGKKDKAPVVTALTAAPLPAAAAVVAVAPVVEVAKPDVPPPTPEVENKEEKKAGWSGPARKVKLS
jgi:seryl-tRNA synthetase